MITTEDLVGDIIFISFKDKKKYIDIGIDGDMHFKVLGYDNIGLWVKHPKLEIVTSLDESGKPLKIDDVVHEVIDANFMISWNNVNTLMHYPDRKDFDYPSEFSKKYGFKIKE